MLLYYGAFITNGNFNLLWPTVQGQVFNSMLQHLLAGRFDVDPAAIGSEGFLRDGHVYAYFGIFCALIRVPLLAFKDGLATDITRLSCLVAICLAGTMKLRAALFVRRQCQPDPVSGSAFLLLAIYIIFGGAEVGYLKASLYQEVMLWAAALGTIFVYCAVRGIILAGFTPCLLISMALVAGLALLARVSTGMGLYTATGLLLAVLVVADAIGREESAGRRGFAGRLLTAILAWRVLVPAAILFGFVVATGFVNFSRWGNPTTFVDFSYYTYNSNFPDRLPRTHEYGLFNIARIPFALGWLFFVLYRMGASEARTVDFFSRRRRHECSTRRNCRQAASS